MVPHACPDTAFCVQWHASYEALKETLLHELAHWAAYHRYGHWQHLGQSEVATSGHGDYWRREVRCIQVRAACSHLVRYRVTC